MTKFLNKIFATNLSTLKRDIILSNINLQNLSNYNINNIENKFHY